MDKYDLTQPDYYSQHLADTHTENTVTAYEDIYNEHGTLLLKKGLPLSPDAVRVILNHKLVKPLETTVTLAGCVDGRQLYQDIMEPLLKSRDLKAIHQRIELKDAIIHNCRLYAKHTLLTQKITVLKLRLPTEYDKALFCAWFCLAIAYQLELGEEEQEAAFLAGLCHDVGMLHLDPAILNGNGAYSAEQWRAMQSHTLIADAFLSYIPKLPRLTRVAVREHHERSDGSGYPNGLFKDRLSMVGQIVAMSDSLCAIRRTDVHTGQLLRLPEMIPILQVNSARYPRAIYRATIAVIKMSPLDERARVDMPNLPSARQLLDNRAALEQCFQAALGLYEELKDESVPRFRIARIMTRHLRQIIVSSGLLDEPIKRWLDHLSQESSPKNADHEMFEIQLMYRELTWNMRQLHRVYSLAASDAQISHPDVVHVLKTVLQQTESLLESAAPEPGKEHTP